MFYIRLFPRHRYTSVQLPDSQRLSNMPPFSLQKVAFRRAKDGLSQCVLPSFAKLTHINANTLQIYFKRY